MVPPVDDEVSKIIIKHVLHPSELILFVSSFPENLRIQFILIRLRNLHFLIYKVIYIDICAITRMSGIVGNGEDDGRLLSLIYYP